MSKEMEELMQKSIISEDFNLTKMIQDIVPIKENRFTDLELEAVKQQNFSLVLYKKENIFTRFFKGIRLTLEKFRIIKASREFVYIKNQNK